MKMVRVALVGIRLVTEPAPVYRAEGLMPDGRPHNDAGSMRGGKPHEESADRNQRLCSAVLTDAQPVNRIDVGGGMEVVVVSTAPPA